MGRTGPLLSLKQKLEIIDAVSKQCDKRNLAKTYKCNLQTIKRIVKKKDTYLKAAEYGDLHRKRERRSYNVQLENALCEWFKKQKSINAAVNNADLLTKAKELSIELENGFEPSAVWIMRWKNRHGIKVPKSHRLRNNHSVNEASGNSTYAMVEICKTEYSIADEGIACFADSTSVPINVDDSNINNSLPRKEQVSTNNTVQERAEEPNTHVANCQVSAEQVIANNMPPECGSEPNTPSISAALQALLVVKQFFILNDMEIGSLFTIEEKILQHWKKNI